MSRYAKTILAALGALSTWGITAAADGNYTQVELWGGLGAIVTTVSVYAIKNIPPKGEASDPGISEVG